MTDYSEDEQVERLRNWWQENGTSVVLAVVLSVTGLLGWRYWQESSQQKAQSASMVYQQMIDALEDARTLAASQAQAELVQRAAQTLVDDYGSTAYADYARFTLARLAVENSEFDEATRLLRDVMSKPATPVVGWTARVRLARVLLHSGDLDAAASVLNASWPVAWQGQAFELRGDLARARGDLVAAREAYQSALQRLDEDGAGHRELVQMKLDDLVPAS
jgi:predicted negative regulator of RcsB-dependent stress response